MYPSPIQTEFIFEVAKGEPEQLSELVRNEMGDYPLKAPLDVNLGVGKS
jgi:DNA polymerase I-like protein with 3'-5' exonuclease and polymerase domains